MSREKTPPIVAIDGPAGVGKSTTARLVADRLGYTLVDTGALYRCVALAAREAGLSWDDGEAVGRLASSLDLELGRNSDGEVEVRMGNSDVSRDIRKPEISMGASTVSKHAPVREALLGQQRRLGEAGGVVLEGRDIGTVVFPEAEVKVFLTASPEVRAERRHRELLDRGREVTFEETLEDVKKRDRQDTTREVAPLRAAEDAVQLDSSTLEVDQVIERVISLVQSTLAEDSL